MIDLLFDGPDDPKASLRWILSELRQAIGPEFIRADRQQIAFNFDSDYWLDVAAFETGQLELYRSDFLEGLNVRDAFGFEEWALFERERLRRYYQSALSERLEKESSQEDDPAVIKTAHQLLSLDNLHEPWHRALMGAYARQGQREAALAQIEPLPLIKDECGLFFRPEGQGFVGGRPSWTIEPGFNFAADDGHFVGHLNNYFEHVVWPLLAQRVSKFDAVRCERTWGGHYAQNMMDGNMILGPCAGEVTNLYLACGFSGHGVILLAGLIAYSWQPNKPALNLSDAELDQLPAVN